MSNAVAGRLLVTDDALIMRMRIREIARAAGWEVVGEAGNGRECLELYSTLRPDLVTLDIVMPEMDGVEALRAIRTADPAARVVMVSALDQKSKLSECIRLGALDFLVKPFDKDRLVALLAKYAPHAAPGG